MPEVAPSRQAVEASTDSRAPSTGSDVFISYSRTDHAFAERLTRALREHGLKVWVDLEGLFAGEEFLPRILSAIEGADAVVFVLSPDAIASPYCLRELEHAELHRKRILPLLRRDVEVGRVPPAAASRQWLFVRDSDDFDQALAALESAIRVDPAWVRTHSRLLQRASEWENRARNRSLALRASELEEAETWLASAHGKDPQPSPLHAEYIVASRRAATRFRGIVLGAVSLGLVVSLVLAGIALLQRNRAVTQYQIATSRQLAAQAVSAFDAMPRLGLLLGAEALRLALAADPSQTMPAEAALHQLLARSGGVPIPLETAQSLRIQVQGSWLLGVDGNGGASLWYRAAPWHAPDGGALLQVWSDSAVRAAALAPDARSLAVVDTTGALSVFGLGDSSITQTPARFASLPKVEAVSFAASGILALETDDGFLVVRLDQPQVPAIGSISLDDASTRVTVGASGRVVAGVEFMGRVLLWNLDDAIPSTPTVLPGLPTEGYATVLSPDERWLAVRDLENVLLFDLNRGSWQFLPVFDDRVRHVAFSADGRWLAAGGGDFTNMIPGDESLVLWRLGPNGPGARFQLVGHSAAVTDFAFTADGRWLVSGDRDGRLLMWDLSKRDPSGEPIAPRGHEGEILQVLALDEGGILTVGLDGLRAWNLAQPFAHPRVISSGSDEARAPTFAANGRWLSVITSGGEYAVRTWELGADGAPIATYTLRGFNEPVLAAAICPDGGCVATATRDGVVQLWRLADGTATSRTLGEHSSAVHSLDFSPDGRWLAAGGGEIFNSDSTGFVRAWDLRNPDDASLALQRDSLDQSVSGLAFDGSGRLAVATGDALEGDGGSVSIWSTPFQTLQSPPDFEARLATPVASLAFAGGRFAAGGQDGRVRMYDGQGWRTVSEFVLHAEPQGMRGVVTTAAHVVAFSPDGKWLASGSLAGPVHLWRMTAPADTPVVLETGAGTTTAASFDPIGRWLAIVDGTGRLTLWNMESETPRLAPLPPGPAQLSEVAFDPRGERLATTDRAGNVLLWDLRADALLERACSIAGRNLTREEWGRFIDLEPYRTTCPNTR
jgi:WD40 repeat protein